MTAAIAVPTSGPILNLALGKFKTVACTYDAASALARFHALPTSRQELRKLFAQVQPAVVLFEACALAGWVLDLCHDCALAAKVANTASEAWFPASTSRAKPITAAGSRAAARPCCSSCWWNAPGPCCVTTPGPGPSMRA